MIDAGFGSEAKPCFCRFGRFLEFYLWILRVKFFGLTLNRASFLFLVANGKREKEKFNN